MISLKLPKTGIGPYDEYTEGVMHGRVNVCRYVQQAVERHYKDLDKQRTKDFPYYFEPKALNHYIDFFASLNHFDGIYAGHPVIFEPWQYFTFGTPFAWLHVDRINNFPIRRFNESIVMVSKKQGKSTIKGGEAVYMTYMDGYPSAQCYILALSATHAKTLAYRDAESLVKNSWLKDELRLKYSAADIGVYDESTNSFFRPMVSDKKKADGPKIHYVLLEEIKDWDDMELYDTVRNGIASDPTAMIANISTAGADMASLGYERQGYASRILSGEIVDERTFAVIYTIDKEDYENWDDMKVVAKANPNFGVSVHESYYEQKITKAKENERLKNDFMTKHLGVWINSMEHYFTMDKWINIGKENKDLSIDDFVGQPCYIFIDLASRKDIVPVQFLFRHGKVSGYKDSEGRRKRAQDRYAVFGRYFLPADVVSEDLVGYRADYNAWATAGLFELTPGNVIDYDAVYDFIEQAAQKFKIIMVGLDDWGIEQFSQNLRKRRVKTVEIPQRVKQLSDPMKTLESFIINEGKDNVHAPRIIHNGDPVLSWAMGNVVAKEDANENVFPRKEHADKKIDPAVALINLFYMNQEKPLPKTVRRSPKILKV